MNRTFLFSLALVCASFLPVVRGEETVTDQPAPKIRLSVEIVQLSKPGAKLMTTAMSLPAKSFKRELTELEARGIVKTVSVDVTTLRDGVPNFWSHTVEEGSKTVGGMRCDEVCLLHGDGLIDATLALKVYAAAATVEQTTQQTVLRIGKSFCFPVHGGDTKGLVAIVTPSLITN